MKLQRSIVFVFVSVLLIALLAACGGGASGGANSAGGSTGGGQTYNVTATEFQFAPNSFTGKPGEKITFNVTNKGTVEHTLAVRSVDGSQELMKIDTQPGETKSGSFTPQDAGTYPIQCDIAGHKEAGMTGQLVVK